MEKDHRINSGKMAGKNKTLFHQIKEVSALLGEKERLAQQNKINTFFGLSTKCGIILSNIIIGR